ncbi:hypothetical protein FSST1_003941 [Fusarium sambucinum]
MTESLNFEAGEGDATNHQKRYWGANPIDAYIVSSDGKMHFWPSTIQAMKRRKAIMEWYSRHKFEPIWADTQLTSAYHLAMRQCEGDFNKLPVHRSDYVDENKYKIDMDINYDTEFYHLPTDRYATTTTDVESFGLAKQNRPKIVRFKSAVQGHHWDEMSDDKNGFPPPGNPELEYLYTSIAYGFDIVLMSPLDKDQAVRGTLRVSESGYKEFRARVRLFKGKHRDFPLEASPREGYHWFPLDWECFEQFSAHQMKVEIEPLTGKIKELKHYDMPSDRLCWFSSKDIYEAFYRLNKEAFNPTVETPGAPNTTLDNAQSTVTTQPKPGLVLTDEEKCLEGLNNKIEGLSNQLEGYTSGQAKQTADFNQKLADAEKLKSDLGQQLADTEKLKSDLGQKLADTEKLAGKQAQHLRNTETMVSEQAQRLNNAENLASEQGQVLNDSKQLVNEQAQRIADTEKLAGKQAKQFIDTKKLVDEQAQRLADAEKLKEGYSQKVEEAKTFVERLEQAEKKTDDRIQKLDQEVENVKSMARKLTSNSNSPAQRKSGGRSPSGPISSPSRTPGGQVRSHFTTPDNPRPRRVSGPGNSGSPLAGKMGKKRESSGTLSPTAQRPKRPRSGKDTIEEGSPEDEYEEVLKGIMS